MVEHGDDWSEAEIHAVVEEYVNLMISGKQHNSTYRELAIKYALKKVPGRNEASVIMRMCNISAVIDAAGGDYIRSWKPRRNVGPTNTARIRDALAESGLI